MKIVGVFLLFSLAAFAQNQPPSIPPSITPTPPQKDFTVQCSAFPTSGQACRSYNEMIAAKDPDILGTISHADSYVCFRSDEDVFLIFSFGDPYNLKFKKKEQSGLLQAPGWVVSKRFKTGQIDDLQIGSGAWETVDEETPPSFNTPSKSDPSIYINDSQISLSHNFKNFGGGTTNYSLQIRRSTLRASESMAWETPPKKPQSPPDRGTMDYEGRCIAFLN